MKKRVIASDIDGVVTDFINPCLTVINRELNTSFQFCDCFDHSVCTSFDIDQLAYQKIHLQMISEGMYQNLPFINGSLEGYERLNEQFEVVFITSRIPELEAFTQKLIAAHLPFARVYFANPSGGNPHGGAAERQLKLEVAHALGAVCLIEDNSHEFKDWTHPAIDPVCYKQPWNESLAASHPHVPRLEWPEMTEYLIGRYGKLAGAGVH